MINSHFSLFADYLEHEKKVSNHTLNAYKSDLSHFFLFLEVDAESLKASEINYQQIRSWVTHLATKKNTPQTINRKLSSLKTFFKFLMVQGVITNNPMLKISGPKNITRLPVYLEEEQTDYLFDQYTFTNDFEGVRDKLILDILYQIGLRRTELVTLKEADINMLALTVKVLGKRNKERLLPISYSLKRNLEAYFKVKKELNLQNMMLLVNEKGNALSPNALYKIVKKYLSQISTLKKRSPHVLRHTFATHLLNNGASILAVKELLGHSSLKATQIYTHNTIENLKKSYKNAHPRGDT